MQQACSGELTPWESPGESIYDVMPQEWRPPPAGLWLADQPTTPCLVHRLATPRGATMGADDVDSHPRCISDKCISDKCAAEVQRRGGSRSRRVLARPAILRTSGLRGCADTRNHETALFRCSRRDSPSVSVRFFPPSPLLLSFPPSFSCISPLSLSLSLTLALPLLPSPPDSDAAGKANRLPLRTLRGRVTHARSATELTHPLHDPPLSSSSPPLFLSLSLSLSFPQLPPSLRRGPDIPAFPPPLLRTLPARARLPRFRTYLRDKRLFIAVHRAARVIKSAARGI